MYMSNLKISVYEVITNLKLEDRGIINGDNKAFLLSQNDLKNIINEVGRRISENYYEEYNNFINENKDMTVAKIVDELNEAFSVSNIIKPTTMKR